MTDFSSDAHTPEGEYDDYEVFRLSISWGMLSIMAFVVVLMLQMFDSGTFGLTSFQAVAATLPLSFLGFVLGVLGIRYGRGQRAARIGVFLNGVVLCCIFVLLPVTFQILRRFSWLPM